MGAYAAALAVVIIETYDLAVLHYHGGIRAIDPACKTIYAFFRKEDRPLVPPVACLEFSGGTASYYKIAGR
jgi:hypothetical protein